MFVDEVEIVVRAGKGGDGRVSFLREKFRPRGGPDGGDGGGGGSIFLSASTHSSSLFAYRHRRVLTAERGMPGQGKERHGKAGIDEVFPVPSGTVVYDAGTGKLLGDLTVEGQVLRVARGGRGGRGNARFKSATRQNPQIATPGEPGEERRLRLELKLIADVGVIGYPNAGKSTLIGAVSHAKPRVADYPFTTLTPHVGVVGVGEFDSFVIADIPGLIPGAHLGKGLGLQFLRHVERTSLLLHLVEMNPMVAESPVERVAAIGEELRAYGGSLSTRPQILAPSKMDLPGAEEILARHRKGLEAFGYPLLPFSAVTGRGVPELVRTLWELTRAPGAAASAGHARPQ